MTKRFPFFGKGLLLFIIAAAPLVTTLVGCSTEEDNPVTPQKMDEIRQKQAGERANFNPTQQNPSGK